MEVAGVHVPGRPDPAAAARVRAGFRRLAWQEIDLTDGTPHCAVRGLRYRLPGTRPVSLGAALALAVDGLPTLVRVRSREEV
jgi:hypothetical protein